jgi:hypothetical protein
MNGFTRLILSGVAVALSSGHLNSANVPPAETVRIIERGPHHQVIERLTVVTNLDGSVGNQTNRYTAVASGLHYRKDGQWVEAKEEVRLLPDGNGAVSDEAQIKVTFAPNINTAGAITTVTPDGKRFRTHVLGLALTDETGKSVLIAPVKDSVGAVWKNQVIYRDAFAGGVNADILFVCERGKFEQNIVLRENLPIDSPAELGLNPATTRLECWTELVEAPEPTKEARIIEAPLGEEQPGETASLRDETLNFGATTIAHGKAFLTEDAPLGLRPMASVAKEWIKTEDQRRFLVERVAFPVIKTQLDALPASSASVDKAAAWKELVRNGRNGVIDRHFPSAPLTIEDPTESMELAAIEPDRKGFVLDYSQVVTSSNIIFEAGTTYLMLGSANLTGTTTIEGGAVVKATNLSAINIIGPIDCRTDLYAPAIFTSMHDDSVGQAIAGSTGNPNTNWISSWFDIYQSNAVKNVRFSFLEAPIIHEAALKVANAQFIKCRWPIYTFDDHDLEVDNALFQDCDIVVSGGGLDFHGRHLTVNRAAQFGAVEGLAGNVYLTNCILANVTNWGNITYTTNSTVHFTNNAPAIFQTLGAGHYYLNINSAYRNIGVTNLPSETLATLAATTTFPPINLTGTTNVADRTLAPQVERDISQPDLGYHYPALDYVAGHLTVTNSTLTLTGGVALASYANVGILLLDNSRFVSRGFATAPNYICRFNSVQEQATNWGNGSVNGNVRLYPYHFGPNAASADLRFTRFSAPANGGYHLYTLGGPYTYSSLTVRDCEFNAGDVLISTTDSWAAFTNNLLNRVYGTFQASIPTFSLYNTLFRGGSCLFDRGDGTWTVKDNVFDGSVLDDFGGGIDHDYNAYVNTSTYLYPGTNTNDLVLSSFSWQTGPLGGRFYQPTNSVFIDTGSITNAGARGMYHFSVLTNGVKEAATRIDRGYHYVAVDPSTGKPHDYDSDNIPDYLEDANGNGAVDSGETDWQDSDSDNDGVSDYIESIQGRSALSAGTWSDTNGIINLRIHTPLK